MNEVNKGSISDNISLSEISKSIQKHDTALEALKSVPEMLSKLASAVGIEKQGETQKKSTWSLGLSEDEEDDEMDKDVDNIMNSDNNPQDDSVNCQIDDILQDIQKSTEYGPDLLPNVTESFLKTVTRPLTKESKSSLKEKIKIPGNCKLFVTPKVNPEIWRLLPSQAKLADVKKQQIQHSLSISLASLANIANVIASNKVNVPKEVLGQILKSSIDAANIIGDEFQGLSVKRRWEIKKFLNPEYSGICSSQIPPSEWLFGNDLNESLKSSKATSTLIRNSMNKSNRYRPYPSTSGTSFTPRAGNLNSYRPFPNQQSRWNGQFRQRFPNRNSSLRQFQPQQAFGQQRFQK